MEERIVKNRRKGVREGRGADMRWKKGWKREEEGRGRREEEGGKKEGRNSRGEADGRREQS